MMRCACVGLVRSKTDVDCTVSSAERSVYITKMSSSVLGKRTYDMSLSGAR